MDSTPVIIRESNSSKPKVIGSFSEESNVFKTVRDLDKHLLRKSNSWAIDLKLLNDLLLPRGSLIVIHSPKEKVTYNVKASMFKKFGKEIEYLNHRPQISLRRDYFEVEG